MTARKDRPARKVEYTPHRFVITVSLNPGGMTEDEARLVPQTVYASSLHEALILAAGLPFGDWFEEEDSDGEHHGPQGQAAGDDQGQP